MFDRDSPGFQDNNQKYSVRTKEELDVTQSWLPGTHDLDASAAPECRQGMAVAEWRLALDVDLDSIPGGADVLLEPAVGSIMGGGNHVLAIRGKLGALHGDDKATIPTLILT
ncbi:hypothetical protein AK812_SmicGene28494 [Symbiodinium microadriaticum]|uniref:Uncharacterized protein n=1 Tax=Symbiodinium microadriaticum TaxID=2951 RepID=A0A1Q9D4E4_SYMMI|nr:hypothetical protein AK812_SmicGene28494 [Symbiodinium microadriaticum]